MCLQSLYQTIVIKKELSWKAKVSIYQAVYILTLTRDHLLSNGQKNGVVNTSGQNECPP